MTSARTPLPNPDICHKPYAKRLHWSERRKGIPLKGCTCVLLFTKYHHSCSIRIPWKVIRFEECACIVGFTTRIYRSILILMVLWWRHQMEHFPRYWPFVGECAWTNIWANTRHTGDLRRHGAYYDVIAMKLVTDNLQWLTELRNCEGCRPVFIKPHDVLPPFLKSLCLTISNAFPWPARQAIIWNNGD